jgi:hypothetical protein
MFEVTDIFENKDGNESGELIKSYAILENLYSMESSSSQNKSETKTKKSRSTERKTAEIQPKRKEVPDDKFRKVGSRKDRHKTFQKKSLPSNPNQRAIFNKKKLNAQINKKNLKFLTNIIFVAAVSKEN